MKRLFALLLALMLVFSLAACGGDTPDTDLTGTDTGLVDPTPDSSGGQEDGTGDSADRTDPTDSTEPVISGTLTDPAILPTVSTQNAATDHPDDSTDDQTTTYKPTYTVTVTKSTGSITSRRDPITTQTVTEPTSSTSRGTTSTRGASADQQTVDKLFTLTVGSSAYNITLTGTVTYVKEVSENYGNATFDLQVQGSDTVKTILCYRVTPADESRMAVAVGDTVTLTGTVQNYQGTIEFYPATYQNRSGGAATTTSKGASGGTIDRNGVYTHKDDVALYLHTYGQLPGNFVTKSQYQALGSPSDKCCGGDRFYNKEGLLPNKSGRLYYECDIDTLGKTSRGTKRIVYSNDGLIYYTGDHYNSFTLLYGEP